MAMVGELMANSHTVHITLLLYLFYVSLSPFPFESQSASHYLHLSRQFLHFGNTLDSALRRVELLTKPLCDIALPANKPRINQNIVVYSAPMFNCIRWAWYLEEPGRVGV